MFLKCSERRKDGKVHRSWSIVESRRYAGGKVAQHHVLYLTKRAMNLLVLGRQLTERIILPALAT